LKHAVVECLIITSNQDYLIKKTDMAMLNQALL